MTKNGVFWLPPPSSLSLASGNDSNARLRRHRQIRRRWAPKKLLYINRAVVVFTGVVGALIVWNFYRAVLGIQELDEQQHQVATAADGANKKQRQLPGIDHASPWQTLLQNRPVAHGPPEWIQELQQNYALNVDNSPLKSTGNPREPDEVPAAKENSVEKHDKLLGHHRLDLGLRNEDQGLCSGFDNSIRRPKHGCQVNKDTTMVFCNFDDLRIDVSKITMTARGGEYLSDVMGRDEEDEFATYQRGAFSTPTKPEFEVPMEYRTTLHYLEDVLNAVRYPTKKNKHKLDLSCQKTYPGTTLFLTRYEYVNLFHTLTDWWNAFFVLPRRISQSSDNIDLDNKGIVRPDRVVFLDGHAKGMLDPVWETVFGNYHFIKHMGDGIDGGICFERAIFVPAGYKSPIFNHFGRLGCPLRRMGRTFSDFVLERYGLLSDRTQVIRGSIVVIDRQPFVAHPRSDPNHVARGFDPPVLEELQVKLKKIPGVTSVQTVRLETISFAEQLKLLRKTQVLIGIHGAALSHLLFMDEQNSHIIEIKEGMQSDFFEYLSQWKGIDHKCIEYYGFFQSYEVDQVVEMVGKYVA